MSVDKQDIRRRRAFFVMHICLLFLPFVLGFIGNIMAGITNPSEAAFQSLLYYFLNSTEAPSNVLQEIARWLAPAMVASGLIAWIQNIHKGVRNFFVGNFTNSVAVYGDGEDADYLLTQLGRRGIHGGQDFVKAKRYVFVGSEDENFHRYERFHDAIGNAPVYLRSGNLVDRKSGGRFVLFNPEETAARQYWKERPIYALAKARNYQMDICIIGFGKLGQNLLNYGILDNIFHPDQTITYHCFGDSAEFRKLNHGYGYIEDKVVFHDEEWYDCIDIIRSAARVILCDDIAVLTKMVFAIPGLTIDVLTDRIHDLDRFEYGGTLIPFDWRKEALNIENIFRESLLEDAKSINYQYVKLYTQGGKVDITKEQAWDRLDTFDRYSNISSADYHIIQRGMLKVEGVTPEALIDPENYELLQLLSELEHIRWTRYHYLNNWTPGEPGTKKDKVLRKHPMLVAFDALTEENKQKDRNNLFTLFGLTLNEGEIKGNVDG